MVGLAALWLAPWAIVALVLLGPSNVRGLLGLDRDRATPSLSCKPGPWGQLVYVPLTLAPPDELLPLPPPDAPPTRWVFQGYSKAKAIEFLRTAGLSDAQLDGLINKAAWSTAAEGAAVEPGDDLILGLSPEARARIYSLLVEFPPNNHQIDPLLYRSSELDAQFKGSGLAASSIATFPSALVPAGSGLGGVCRHGAGLAPPGRRRGAAALMKAVYRKETFLLRLRIDADSDTDKLAAYWGVGGRKRDLVSLFRAMRRLERGVRVSTVTLLPAFARNRIYSFPFLTSSAGPASRTASGPPSTSSTTRRKTVSTTWPTWRSAEERLLRDL